MKAKTLESVRVNMSDLSIREDTMLPLTLVRVLDSLHVQIIVDGFDQFQSDNAVVCCFVGDERAFAFLRREVVECVYALWVEDFVDTVR